MIRLVPFLFFCSGATALIYEVVWSKYLSLIFGSTVQAQTIVLAVFMGGLALGNWLFGRRADLLKKPLAFYGGIEIALGLYAAAFHALYLVADGIFIRVGAGFLEQRALLLSLKGILSVILLLGPTILMGGTLPLLAAWLQNRKGEAAQSSARFYAINTLGAVVGAGLAGFFLVRQFGVQHTLFITAGANVLIGVIALAIARGEKSADQTRLHNSPKPAAKTKPVAKKETPAENADKPSSSTEPFPMFGGVIVFLTGAAAMGLEILASRSLGMIFGGSLEAFSVMLMSFILGIGAGSFVLSLRKAKLIAAATTVPLLIAAAAMIGLFLLATEQFALLYLKVRNVYGGEKQYLYHQLVSGGIALVVIGLPAGLIGAVLPLWMRLATTSSGFAERVGRLLTWNTLGAVTGALLTGFILMPMAGLRLSFGLWGVVLSLGALLVAWKNRLPNSMIVSVFSAVAIFAIGAVGKENWQHLLTSGIFRMREKDVSGKTFADLRQRDQLLFYEDGSDATVSIVTDRIPRADSETVLTINGKPDASTLGDLSTQYLLAHLPMLMRPESADIFILGFGSGITGGAILGHPVKSLTIAENCEPVLRAADHFSRWNRGVHTNALTRIYREDARAVLKLNPHLYDIIISEPSNPWVAGMASVFSHEFYELAASRLKEGGVMAQWFHIYEMDDNLVALVLRTFHSVFPSMEIWETRSGDLIVLGAKKPWSCSPEKFRVVFARSQPKDDLNVIGFKTPESVLARQLASQSTAGFIPGVGPFHSDFHPILDYDAPKAFYEGVASYALFVFDERTLQSTFAPLEKREALLSLSDDELVSVYRKYGSANYHLMQYMAWRAQKISPTSRGYEVYREAPFLNFIFRRPESYPKEPTFPPNAGPIYKMFLEGEALVHQPDLWKEGVEMIEKLLRNHSPGRDDDPYTAHFAGIAARARFNHGDVAGALEIVETGLKIEPHDVQLHYLRRLLRAKSGK